MQKDLKKNRSTIYGQKLWCIIFQTNRSRFQKLIQKIKVI